MEAEEICRIMKSSSEDKGIEAKGFITCDINALKNN
jgi:hypothetical protein